MTNKIRIEFSFDGSILKNKTFGLNNGRIYVSDPTKKIRSLIESVCLEECNNRKIIFEKRKVWIEIYVQKPDNRSDAINVIDNLCDGIKKGIKVDDRWFSIKSLDWEVKKDGKISVLIYQD